MKQQKQFYFYCFYPTFTVLLLLFLLYSHTNKHTIKPIRGSTTLDWYQSNIKEKSCQPSPLYFSRYPTLSHVLVQTSVSRTMRANFQWTLAACIHVIDEFESLQLVAVALLSTCTAKLELRLAQSWEFVDRRPVRHFFEQVKGITDNKFLSTNLHSLSVQRNSNRGAPRARSLLIAVLCGISSNRLRALQLRESLQN